MAKIILDGNEVEVPEAEVQWFINEKGAKRASAKSASTKPKTEKKETK